MEFGVGLLGKNWNVEDEIERRLTSTTPPRLGIVSRASSYAAMIAGETVLCVDPHDPDLSDKGIVMRLAHTAPGPRLNEAPAIRAAFLTEYGGYMSRTAPTLFELKDTP